MACKYFYDNNEYTFDEFASLLESGLADELVAKNVLSSSGVYNKKAPVDTMPGAITINASNTNVPLGKGKNPLTRLARQTQNMVKALSKLSPDISFTIHATEESWNDLKDQMLSSGTDISGMDGFYDPNTSQVHLNYPLMKELGRFNTGFHEGYHPLTNALFDSRPDLRNMMFDQLVIMSRDNQLSKEFRDQIKEVIDFGEEYRMEYGPTSVMNESIVEFLSRVSSGQINIDAGNKSLLAHIKTFLNNLASMLNIGVMMGNKEYTVDNLLDFARAVDFAFKQGVAVDFNTRNIPTEKLFNTKDAVENLEDKFILQPSITNYGNSGLVKTPILDTKELDESIKKGNISIQNPYKFIGNANFMKTFPDDLFVGDLKIGNEKIASGDGGIFYAAKYGDKGGAWASVNEQTATSFVNNANESLEINKEKGIPFGVVALVKGDKIKHQTSLQGKAGMVNVILSLTKNEDGTANQEVLNALNKLYNLGTTSKNVKKIQANINSMLKGGRSEASQTMNEAKNFYEKFRSELIKSAGKELGLMVDKLGLENTEKYFNKSKLKSGEKIISNDGFDLLYQTLFAEDAIQEIKPGEAYAALVFTSKLEVAPEDTEHPSYPFPIRTVDGSPVKLVVFSKTFPTYDNRSDEDKKAGVKKVIATKGREPNKAGEVSEGAFGAASYTKPVYTLDSSAEDNSPFQYNLLDQMKKYSATESMAIQPSLAGEFVAKLNETKKSDPKQYWSVDTVSLEDAKQGTVIKTEAGYGFVSQSGDIKGIFKANKESSEKTGDEVLKKAVKAGGIKLDNFDGYLTKIYERNGFRIASRIPFNEEYAPDGWNKEAHGTPDVVAMVYDPAKQLDIEEKRFEDYMEGIDYRDSFVDLAYGNAVTNGAIPPRIDPRPNDLVSASSIVYDMTEDGNGNYVFYTSNVSGKNADVDEDGMLNLSTEKGIQPSMVKVPYESTYPLDTNPLGLKPKIQPSIIGETGAAELDSAYKNMNNLAVAKKMKAQKKSKQFIKTSTGWELGPDGFWRMEISDSKFSYTDGQLNKIIDKAIDGDFTYKSLSDVITNKQLFDAYPELKKVNVVFGKTGKVRFSPTAVYNMAPTTGAVYLSGGYGDNHIIINSESLKEKGTDELLSYMEHEIQHYIQDKEGFTQGSDTKDEFNTLISKIEDEIFAKSGNPLERKLSNELNRLSTERNALASNPSEENKQKYVDLYNQKLSIYDNYAKDVLKIGSVYDKAYQNYKNKFGEIEARNVQLRRLIPFELRADMLFESTQDVKNKDAIFTKNDKKIIAKLETYRNKSILQQAKNLGFAAVVDKDMEGNAVVMSDTVMPAEPVGTVQHASNKQTIQPSLGWGGSKGVQEIKVGSIARQSMAPVSPIKGNVKELSNRQQSAFFNNFRTFFSATQGNSQAAKSLQENLLGAKSEIINQIDKNAIELSKLVKAYVKSDAAKAAGLSQDTVHRIVNGAIIGETNPLTGVKFIDMLPQDLADAVVKARQNIVTLQEILVQTGLLPAEIEAVIATTIGSYSKRSFYAFELPKKKGIFNMFSKQKKSTWFESVPQDVRDRAREIFKAMAMNGTLDNGFNIALNDYKKNFEEPYLALIAADPSMQSNATQQAAMAMNNALVDLQNKAGEFADAVMRRIEDVNQVGDVNFTIGGSVVSMKDYIEKNPALPREIREYLGEIKDPAINFRLTAMKLTRMLFNHQTVAQFKNLGLQTGDVVTASEPTPAGWIKLGEVTQAEVKGKKGTANDEMDALNRYGALKGCSITPALYDLLFDTPIEGTLYYKYITTNVKKFKTIYSPSTQIKNLYGYTFFGMTSGAIPEGLFYSAKIASAAYNQISTQDGFLNYWNEIFTEAKRRGINTSLEIEEINRVGRELSQNKELLRSLKGSNNPATEIYQYFTEMFTNTENVFKQGMALGDAIPKTIMFEVFRNTNAAILNGTSYYELDERQKELANEMASRKVKLTTVTDTRTIKGIDFIQRKMGIFGTFPRFLSESVRNFVNAHLLIVNPSMLHEGLILSNNKAKDAELKKQMDLKTRAAGMAGLAGYYGLMALLKAAISFGDDDDDKVNADVPSSALLEASQIYNKPKGTLTQSEALRMLVPEYDKFADLSFEVKKDGTIEYKNESSVDPFNVFPQAFRSYIYSDNIATGTANAVKQVADPVIGWEIMFGTALEIINNENSKGAVIYKNYDDFADKASDALAYAFRKVGPGIATSSMRYKDLVKGGQRESGAFGYINFMLVEGSKGRVSTMEVEAKLKAKVSEINNSWIDDQRSYKGDFYKDKSEQERAKLNQERDNNARMYAFELNQLVEAGYTLGLSTGQVKQVFKDARVSKKVRNAAMRGGTYIDKLNIDDIKED